MTATIDRAVHEEPRVRAVPRAAPTDPARRPPLGDAAFVASLAVGLASAGWSPSRAVPELVAAADGVPEVLAAARSWLRRKGTARPDTSRAAHLLLRAEMTLTAPAVAS